MQDDIVEAVAALGKRDVQQACADGIDATHPHGLAAVPGIEPDDRHAIVRHDGPFAVGNSDTAGAPKGTNARPIANAGGRDGGVPVLGLAHLVHQRDRAQVVLQRGWPVQHVLVRKPAHVVVGLVAGLAREQRGEEA